MENSIKNTIKTIVLSPEELQELIENAVDKAITRHLSSAIRKAVRKEYLTTDELSELTGWSRRTIQHLRDSRQIPFYQDGRRILFRTQEIENYLGNKRVRPRDK